MLEGRCIALYQYYRLRYRCYTRGARSDPGHYHVKSDQMRWGSNIPFNDILFLPTSLLYPWPSVLYTPDHLPQNFSLPQPDVHKTDILWRITCYFKDLWGGDRLNPGYPVEPPLGSCPSLCFIIPLLRREIHVAPYGPRPPKGPL